MCPPIWSNITLGVSVRVLLIRLTFELADSVKQSALPRTDGPHPIGRRPEQNKMKVPPTGKGELFLPALRWDINLFWPSEYNRNIGSFWVTSLSASQAQNLLPWFSGLCTPNRTTPWALLGLQRANCRSWDFSASTIK